MKDNKIDVETTIAMTKMDFSDDPETIKLVTAIASECADTTGKNKFCKVFLVDLFEKQKNIHVHSRIY